MTEAQQARLDFVLRVMRGFSVYFERSQHKKAW